MRTLKMLTMWIPTAVMSWLSMLMLLLAHVAWNLPPLDPYGLGLVVKGIVATGVVTIIVATLMMGYGTYVRMQKGDLR